MVKFLVWVEFSGLLGNKIGATQGKRIRKFRKNSEYSNLSFFKKKNQHAHKNIFKSTYWLYCRTYKITELTKCSGVNILCHKTQKYWGLSYYCTTKLYHLNVAGNQKAIFWLDWRVTNDNEIISLWDTSSNDNSDGLGVWAMLGWDKPRDGLGSERMMNTVI